MTFTYIVQYRSPFTFVPRVSE